MCPTSSSCSPAAAPISLRAKIVAATLLSVVTALVLLAASWANLLPEAQDRVLYDWRSYYLTNPTKEQRRDIALVFINEDSLTGYTYLSPINRGLIAELVRVIDAAGAKVIGLDLIIDRPTEPPLDQALTDAVRTAKSAKIVQAVFLGKPGRPQEATFQQAYLTRAGAIPAHLYFASERNRFTLGDQVVRYRIDEGIGDPPRSSFGWALAEAAGIRLEQPPSNLITWQRLSRGSLDLFPRYIVRPHLSPNGTRIGDVLSPRALASLAGKIVLIGGAFTDRDRYLTPWTAASGERVPGVEVHAQILAHLIDKRWTFEPAWWWELPLLVLVGCLGFYAAAHWKMSGSGFAATAAALIVMIVAGIALYWLNRIILPSASLAGAWSAGLFFGSLSDWGFDRLRRWGVNIH